MRAMLALLSSTFAYLAYETPSEADVSAEFFNISFFKIEGAFQFWGKSDTGK
jgi:hypothetical protein